MQFNYEIPYFIYTITNNLNGKLYVGSTKNVISRFRTHMSLLNNNIHNNAELQLDYNNHGSDNFSFDVVEIISEQSELLNREAYWINSFNDGNLYNVRNINDITCLNKNKTKLKTGTFNFIDKVCTTKNQKEMLLLMFCQRKQSASDDVFFNYNYDFVNKKTSIPRNYILATLQELEHLNLAERQSKSNLDRYKISDDIFDSIESKYGKILETIDLNDCNYKIKWGKYLQLFESCKKKRMRYEN